MDEIISIFLSWQFLLVSGIVFLIFGFFNGINGWKGAGAYLWKLGGKPNFKCLRKIIKFFEAVKIPMLSVIGFCLGFVPGMPRPEQFEDSSTLPFAFLCAIAGMFSMFTVKSIKKALQSKGIDIDLDLTPKDQTTRKR